MRLKEEAGERVIVDPVAKYQMANLNAAVCDDSFLAAVDARNKNTIAFSLLFQVR